MTLSWLYLVLAGLAEVGWPIGLKMAQLTATRWKGIAIAGMFMVMSGWLFWLAQKQIPVGIAYAVWAGMGAAGAFLAGIYFFGESASLAQWVGVTLITTDVVMLKLAH